jgi:hypothetical protein
MRFQTYRDESRSRHFDLVSGGEHSRSIDLVLALTSGMLVVDAACALLVPFASTVAHFSQWSTKRDLETRHAGIVIAPQSCSAIDESEPRRPALSRVMV